MNTIEFFVVGGNAVASCLALIFNITLYVNLCLPFHYM